MEGRGQYFKKYGIVCDIIQSHSLHTITLFAIGLDGEDFQNENLYRLRF